MYTGFSLMYVKTDLTAEIIFQYQTIRTRISEMVDFFIDHTCHNYT